MERWIGSGKLAGKGPAIDTIALAAEALKRRGVRADEVQKILNELGDVRFVDVCGSEVENGR